MQKSIVKNDVPFHWSRSSLQLFHYILTRYSKLQRGWKLVRECLSLVYLSKGEVHAILALSGNITSLKLLLTAMANGLLKTFADSFISFDGILCITVDFLLLIFLESFFASQVETIGRWLFPATATAVLLWFSCFFVTMFM